MKRPFVLLLLLGCRKGTHPWVEASVEEQADYELRYVCPECMKRTDHPERM